MLIAVNTEREGIEATKKWHTCLKLFLPSAKLVNVNW